MKATASTLLITTIITISALLNVQTVSATTITFEELDANQHTPYGKLTNQYDHLGVNFSGDWITIFGDPTFGSLPLSGDNQIGFNQRENNSLAIHFDKNINNISGFIGGGMIYDHHVQMNWTVNAYLDSNQVAQQSYHSNFGWNRAEGHAFFDLSFDNANYVEIIATTKAEDEAYYQGLWDEEITDKERWGYKPGHSGVLDNLSFSTVTDVPEPSSLAILLLGLLGLSSRKIKKIK